MIYDHENVKNDNDSVDTVIKVPCLKVPCLTRLTSRSVSTNFKTLFFCGKPSSPNDKLRQALTVNVDNRVLTSGRLLGDSVLLAKLASREHKYHSSRLLAVPSTLL
jgi:hypothetical protein